MFISKRSPLLLLVYIFTAALGFSQTNFLQNSSFENWSGNPETPDNWTIANENSLSKITDATEGNFALELDLNDAVTSSGQTNLSTKNINVVKLRQSKTYYVTLDHKVLQGLNISVVLTVSYLNGNLAFQQSRDVFFLNGDGNWHTRFFNFTSNHLFEDHIIELTFQASNGPANIIRIDNVKILDDAPIPNADDDDDGVTNNNDNCPNTPSAETVDTNGCSESQLDDDNDGVTNNNDNCPNTPADETVDINGCAQSQLDDDNDGVTNNNDTCPNTPSGESVDANGCSESQLDDDNDGVTNNNDTCPNTPTGTTVDTNGCPVTGTNDADNDGVTDTNDTCPNTPTGESVNTSGCSESQLDDDNDGVTNDNDTCPNTPSGVSVNAEGCAEDQTSLPNIPSNGIQVKATSTSCPNSSNGEITIRFDQDYSYTVQIKASLLDNTIDNVTSTNGLVHSELPADTYSVCITIPEFPSFEQCFTVVVETPESLLSGKTLVNKTRKNGTIIVSGSKNYELLVNDRKMNFSFNDTGRHELGFELEDGANNILVKTDKNCQGEFAETVMLNSIRVFPNPTTDIITILGLKNDEDATISISNMSGVLIKSYVTNINNTSEAIDVADLPEGMYLVRVKSNEQDVQTKIVKK